MKIAVVGKGGSGKSTVSWLLSEFLAAQGKEALAIDADHNMDLTSNVGHVFHETDPTIHHAHEQFMNLFGLAEGQRWHEIFSRDTPLPVFSFVPHDPCTASLIVSVKPGISLMNVGLGSDDILTSDRCAHGHSNPLKYYLALVQTGGNAHIIADSVAGIDMMNFGLYNGMDMIVGVVEGHVNSIKVFEQISGIAKASGIPMYAILNRAAETEMMRDFVARHTTEVIGSIPLDSGVAAYDFSLVSSGTLQALQSIWNAMNKKYVPVDYYERLRSFETKKHPEIAAMGIE